MAKISKTVKMADIAKQLNISTVTVSKALSEQKGVSEEVRAKIKQLAKEMGYQYIPKGSGKATGFREGAKSYTIGILISQRYAGSSKSFYWKLYQEVAEQAMQRSCFTLLEIIQDVMEEEELLPRLVSENKADCLIVLGKPGKAYADMLDEVIELPIVFLDFYDAKWETDSVISNGYMGAYLLTKYLISKGHTDIGYVGTLLATDSITDRYLGYTKALLEQGIMPKQEWLIEDRDIESGLMIPEVHMKLPDAMPSAFVCNCDMIAGQLINLIRDKGLRVPEDVSVVGFDNYLDHGLCDIGITTYEVDMTEMARRAVSILLKKLAGTLDRAGISVVEGKLIEKESVAKR